MALQTDITIGTKSSDTREGAEKARDGRFWLEPLAAEGCTPVHDKVVEWAKSLRDVWRPMAQLDREHDAIYENRALRSSTSRLAPGLAALKASGFDTARLFVTTSIVDTFKNRFQKRRSMPMFVVDDAEYELKQRAQDFRRWLHGKFMESKFDRLRARIITDALIRGDGCIYVDDNEDDVFIERVHRREVLIDPYEADQGPAAVRTMYRVRTVSRDSLKARFPHLAKQIDLVPEASDQQVEKRGDVLADKSKIGTRDVVDLFEVWHLPSKYVEEDEVGDGRVAVCCDGLTLCYEEWKEPRFPIVRVSCFPPQEGYWGRGIVELLRGDQAELNRMVADISMNIRVTGKGIWMTSVESQVQPEQLSGYRPIFLAVPGAGMKPEFHHPPPVSPAAIQLIEKKIEWMHNHTGAAQWFSTGRSPLGAGASGVALDTQEDLYSDRHASLEDDMAHFMVDSAQALLDAARRWSRRGAEDKPVVIVRRDEKPMRARDEDDEGYDYEDEDEDDEEPAEKPEPTKKRRLTATWMDKGGLQRLDFEDCSLHEDQYRLQIEPSGFLPSTRAGKLAMTSELVGKGVIPQEMALTLYDEPDIAHVNRNELALRRNAERIVEQAGNPKKPMPAVEEWHPLDLLLDLTKKYFNRAQAENAPPEVEVRLRELGDMVLLVQERMKPPAAPPGDPMAADPMAGAMPPGAPMPPGPPGPPGAGLPLPADPAAGLPIDPSMMPPMAA